MPCGTATSLHIFYRNHLAVADSWLLLSLLIPAQWLHMLHHVQPEVLRNDVGEGLLGPVPFTHSSSIIWANSFSWPKQKWHLSSKIFRRLITHPFFQNFEVSSSTLLKNFLFMFFFCEGLIFGTLPRHSSHQLPRRGALLLDLAAELSKRPSCLE